MAQVHRPATPVAGFISPPRWCDPSPAEFARVCAAEVLTQQCPVPLPDLDFSMASIAESEPAALLAAKLLGGMGCHAVGVVGTPFAWAGLAGEAAARARIARLAEIAGVPAVSAATAIVDALRALGARRVALACSYYPPDWRDAWRDFVAGCGFEVLRADTLADQGLVATTAAMDDEGWSMTDARTRATTEVIARAAPQAEAIVVAGAGTRTLALIGALEAAAGRPVIGSDTALYHALARTLGLPLKPAILGAITEV